MGELGCPPSSIGDSGLKDIVDTVLLKAFEALGWKIDTHTHRNVKTKQTWVDNLARCSWDSYCF